ncbi:MAG: 2-C-methyl-D-erythritol 2,4-cyclodiphosphate synthase [Spirochaetes bacterium]|nr:2-C-methyl-D-erythritol 2,4-cyclodiphosphate synthase [Spirochaetota bacterium]
MNAFRVGTGYDSHRFAAGRPFILGGVTIPNDRGLQGHSDADALIHALIDALFGALGESDIGTHFPDTDPGYKNIASLKLLAHAVTIMRTKGYELNNADATIICERPKLREHIAAMRTNIAAAFGVDSAQVTVKAKSNEGMDDVGAGAGVAVIAMVSIRK